MSRSNPNADRIPNPAERFFEWKGGDGGHLQYYDKDKKENITVKTPFTFIVLDQLATIRGYNKPMKTGLYANEVRDTRAERLVVKYFTGGKVAEGFYAEIKDEIKAAHGHFVSNVYVAFKDGKALKLGAIQFQGCSLSPWFDFVKENRSELYKQSVTINKGKLNDEGKIEFTPPVYSLKAVSPETDEAAKVLDAQLQEFLKGYFSRTVAEKTESPASETGGASERIGGGRGAAAAAEPVEGDEPPVDDDDVPF
jgi:hypothetical protein